MADIRTKVDEVGLILREIRIHLLVALVQSKRNKGNGEDHQHSDDEPPQWARGTTDKLNEVLDRFQHLKTILCTDGTSAGTQERPVPGPGPGPGPGPMSASAPVRPTPTTTPAPRNPSQDGGPEASISRVVPNGSPDASVNRAVPDGGSRAGSSPGRSFSIGVGDTGKKLIPILTAFLGQDAFEGQLSVTGLSPVDWADLAQRSARPDADDQLAIRHKPALSHPGVSFVELGTTAKFEFPDFSRPGQKPSDVAAAESYLDALTKIPPRGQIPYYVGPPLAPDFDSLLYPGDELLDFPVIPGVNTVYWHVGARDSGTAFHREDALLRSCNLTLSGWKLWIMIRERHTAKFEGFVKQHWRVNGCGQFIRHQALLIGPQRLRAANIEFDIRCAGPGDMIVTSPGQYHAVVNFGPCFSVAINFLLPGEPVIPPSLAVCEACGLWLLKHENFRLVPAYERDASDEDDHPPPPRRKTRASHGSKSNKRGADSTPPARASKKTRGQPRAEAMPGSARAARAELAQVVKAIKKFDPLAKIPSFDAERPPAPEVLKLAAAIWGRQAVAQLCSLIGSRRQLGTDTARLSLSGDRDMRITQHAVNIKTSHARTKLEKVLVRLHQLCLAKHIQATKDGRIRAEPAVIDKIKKETGWPKATIDYHRAAGNKWLRICGPYDGLLFLLPLEKMPALDIMPYDYFDLDERALEAFHGLLDDSYTRSVCAAAKAFQDSLLGITADVEFMWEKDEAVPDKLPERALLSRLQPLPYISENIYDPARYPGWPRPRGWPAAWPWPADPTALMGGGGGGSGGADADVLGCELCGGVGCACLGLLDDKPKPHIKDYGARGFGLQAVAPEPGGLVYKKGEVFGLLAGEIIPTHDGYSDDEDEDDHDDGSSAWMASFVRPDLPNEPAVCRIRFARTGSCFRLLNRADENASAQFVRMRIGARYVVAVKAMRDIFDGNEITVRREKGYFGE